MHLMIDSLRNRGGKSESELLTAADDVEEDDYYLYEDDDTAIEAAGKLKSDQTA